MTVSKTSKKSASKSTKAPSSKKAAPKTPAKAAAPVKEVVETPVVNEVVETPAPFAELTTAMTEFYNHMQGVMTQLNALKTEFRALEKKVQKEGRQYQRLLAKKKRKSGNRQPSGFVKPTPISDELATFLGKAKGSEMARTDVTKEINAYIQKHNLKDAKNGRIIHPDSKLSKLLKVGPKDELTFFNLQKYMSHHFQKAKPSSA